MRLRSPITSEALNALAFVALCAVLVAALFLEPVPRLPEPYHHSTHVQARR